MKSSDGVRAKGEGDGFRIIKCEIYFMVECILKAGRLVSLRKGGWEKRIRRESIVLHKGSSMYRFSVAPPPPVFCMRCIGGFQNNEIGHHEPSCLGNHNCLLISS